MISRGAPPTLKYARVPLMRFVLKESVVSRFKLRTESSVPARAHTPIPNKHFPSQHRTWASHTESKTHARPHAHTNSKHGTSNTTRQECERTADIVRADRKVGQLSQVAHGIERACDAPTRRRRCNAQSRITTQPSCITRTADIHFPTERQPMQ